MCEWRLSLFRKQKVEKVRYCTKDCQRAHLSEHKKICKSLTLFKKDPSCFPEIQKRSIASDMLKMVYLNPNKARTLSLHGADTQNVARMNKHVQETLKLMKLNPANAQRMYADPMYKGTYARCFRNTCVVRQKRGGANVWGWSLFEGKYCVEAEYHSVWVPPNTTRYVNVTTNIGGQPYSGMFIESFQPLINGVASPNRLYWK